MGGSTCQVSLAEYVHYMLGSDSVVAMSCESFGQGRGRLLRLVQLLCRLSASRINTRSEYLFRASIFYALYYFGGTQAFASTAFSS
jgi:hypothetical protein